MRKTSRFRLLEQLSSSESVTVAELGGVNEALLCLGILDVVPMGVHQS